MSTIFWTKGSMPGERLKVAMSRNCCCFEVLIRRPRNGHPAVFGPQVAPNPHHGGATRLVASPNYRHSADIRAILSQPWPHHGAMPRGLRILPPLGRCQGATALLFPPPWLSACAVTRTAVVAVVHASL